MFLSKKEIQELVKKKIEELHEAINKLQEQTIPYTSLPHPRTFKLLNENVKIVWPGQPKDWYGVKVGEHIFRLGLENNHIANMICEACKYQPAKILRVIRRIDAATEWCKRRTEGRKRAVEEILKQQKKAVDALTALAVAYKLTRSP